MATFGYVVFKNGSTERLLEFAKAPKN